MTPAEGLALMPWPVSELLEMQVPALLKASPSAPDPLLQEAWMEGPCARTVPPG